MSTYPFIPFGHPVSVTRGEGAYLVMEDGSRILDAAGGAIVTNIGHGRGEVAKAVAKATEEEGYVVPPWHTPSRVRLIERLAARWLPPHLSRVHLACGGSEGVESAMKIAIQHFAAVGRPEKCKIVGRSISYHGTTLATTAVAGHAARKRGLEHVLQSYPSTPTPYPLRCPGNDPAGYYLEAFEATVEAEGPNTIAAFVGEPIVGASGGAIVPPDAYWPGIREICDRHEILLIADEVMTGFGRTGRTFGYQHWPYAPDILVAGKGIAGGYAPLTGVFATEAIAAPIGGNRHQCHVPHVRGTPRRVRGGGQGPRDHGAREPRRARGNDGREAHGRPVRRHWRPPERRRDSRPGPAAGGRTGRRPRQPSSSSRSRTT